MSTRLNVLDMAGTTVTDDDAVAVAFQNFFLQHGIIISVEEDKPLMGNLEQGRPFPYMVEQLMRSGGITDSKEVVKIGDTEVDINEGRNAGCGFVVAVTSGAFSRAQLQQYHPDHVIDKLSELQNIIGK